MDIGFGDLETPFRPFFHFAVYPKAEKDSYDPYYVDFFYMVECEFRWFNFVHAVQPRWELEIGFTLPFPKEA